MPINVFKFVFLFHVTKVCFKNFIIFFFKNGVLCITLPCRRGSRPDGARLNLYYNSHDFRW